MRFQIQYLQFVLVLGLMNGRCFSKAPTDDKPKAKIDVVFVLDTTGSMSGLIHAAKEKIWAIANTIGKGEGGPKIRMGLVGYRDRGDNYVTIQTPLTEDLDAVYSDLMSYKAEGGGDTPESVNEALHHAIGKLTWEEGENVYRVVYLVGDAPPHMDYQDDTKYPDSCRMALEKKIFVNTIQCGSIQETTPIWQEIAELASGRYAAIPQSGGNVLPASPYDKEIADLSVKLDGTRLYYGSSIEKTEQISREKTTAKIYTDASVQSIAQRAAYNCSASGMSNFCGNQELVNDITEGKVKLESLDKTLLPDSLQALSDDAIKELIDEKAKLRKELQSEIGSLTKKRQEWLMEQIAKSGKEQPELDRIIFDTIKSQAAKSGIKFLEVAPSL